MIRMHPRSSGPKKLTYPVECPIGRYTIKLKVYSESTGYFATASTRFDVGSEFTRGFYILKETADGNTDFDLYVNEDTPIKENILTLTGQETLKGKPLFISNVASHGYLDEAGDYQGAHTICVTTEEGDLGFYDTNSMLKIHDRSDVLNGGMAADEKPYTAFSFGASNFFLSSKGTYMSYVYAMMPTSGTFQMHGTGTNGGSQFVCSDGSYNVFFWDEQNQCVNVSENIQFGQVFGTYDNNGFSTEGLTCLSCGSNLAVNNAYFILGRCGREEIPARSFHVRNGRILQGNPPHGAGTGFQVGKCHRVCRERADSILHVLYLQQSGLCV